MTPHTTALSSGHDRKERSNAASPRVAVVGAGKFGRRHIATLARLQDAGSCELVAVVDTASEQLQEIGSYGSKLETRLESVLPDADLVDIVTPASTHYSLAKQCLEANKHIVVEKPLTTTFDEACEIHRLGLNRKRLVGVGHLFRYHKLTQKLKKLIDAGEIGEVTQIEGQFLNPNQPRSDVGSILNYSHFIDLSNFLLGSLPSEVNASVFRSTRNEFESNAITIFDYPTMAQAILHVGWAGRRKRRYLAVEGSLATVTVDYLNQSFQILHDGSSSEIDEKTSTLESTPGTEPLYLELSDFLDCAVNGNTPLANSLSGVGSVYLCQRALQSAHEGRALKCEIQDNDLMRVVLSSSESIAAR